MSDNIGIFPGVPFDEYAKIDALNGSSLVNMRRSPLYYRWCLDNPQPPTGAMILGTATHQLILEPERVGDFAVWGTLPEEKVRQGKVWDNFCALNKGAFIVTKQQRDDMVGMAIGARKNLPIMKYASAKGPCEVVLVWRDKETGRLMKGRLDKIIPASHTIFDLKTCRSCQKYKFGGQAYQLNYHIKMAIYWLGYRTLTGHEPHMKLGAIESKAPFESAVYRVTPDVLSQGLDDLTSLLITLAQCEATGEWPAAEPDELELSLPSYAYSDTADDLSDLQLVEE